MNIFMPNILENSYKNRFKFRLGTTSFIYPDSYAANVRLLAPFFDEIELLMFESQPPDSLPTKTEIRELHRLAREFKIRYNVHLPYDVEPGAHDSLKRQKAVDSLRTVIELTSPLEPTTYTLHLSYTDKPHGLDNIAKWKERIGKSLREIVGSGIISRSLSIENLNYPLQWLDETIIEHDLSLCLDTGHLFLNGDSLTDTFASYRDRIILIHLHGYCDDRDHLSLNRLPPSAREDTAAILRDYTSSVSIEVFNFDHLRSSLEVLEKFQESWKDQTKPSRGGDQ